MASQPLRRARAPARAARAGRSRRRSRSTPPSSTAPSGTVAHAGWYGSSRCQTSRSRKSPTAAISATSSTGHQRWSAPASAHAAEQHHEKRCQAGLDASPQRVRHVIDPPQESVGGVAGAREGVGSRERPLRRRARDRESPSCRRSTPAPSSRGRARASRPRSRDRARRRAARAAVVPKAVPESRRADHLGAAVQRSPRRGTGPRASRARAARPSGRPPGRTGAVSVRRRSIRSLGARRW